jgi:hypothetical protein
MSPMDAILRLSSVLRIQLMWILQTILNAFFTPKAVFMSDQINILKINEINAK